MARQKAYDPGKKQTEGSNRRNFNLVTRIGLLAKRSGTPQLGPIERSEKLILRQVNAPTKAAKERSRRNN